LKIRRKAALSKREYLDIGYFEFWDKIEKRLKEYLKCQAGSRVNASSSLWMKNSGLFISFNGWAEGYGSFTFSYMDLGKLINYVKNQQEHHRKKSFEKEYKSLLIDSGVKIDERFFP
jgi:hypothetical protein